MQGIAKNSVHVSQNDVQFLGRFPENKSEPKIFQKWHFTEETPKNE